MIEDYITSSATYTIFGDEEKDPLIESWDKEDHLLLGLQHTLLFNGYTRWSELRPKQFKFLIIHNLELFYELDKVDRKDPDHPVVVSLDNLISGLIHCLFLHADIRLEFLKIQRVAPAVVNFDFHASVMLENVKGSSPPGLTVIVDNTKVVSLNGISLEIDSGS
jgi:hypothetical protein